MQHSALLMINKMNNELEQLQRILSKNAGEIVNINDEIKDDQDLQDAWSIFPEYQDVRDQYWIKDTDTSQGELLVSSDLS